MQAISLFSSAPWTLEQVDWMLRTHFHAEDDDYQYGDYPHGKGWMIHVAPGRRVTVEDGTDDILGFPDVILERQTWLLAAPPIRRLSIHFATGAVREEGFTRQSVEAFRLTGPHVTDPDLELNTALWVGAIFARCWPVAFDDLASRSWRPDPDPDPRTLHAGNAPQPRPASVMPNDYPLGYESRPAQNVQRSPPRSTSSRGVFSWMWRHKFLSWMLWVAATCLLGAVLPKALSGDVITVLGLIAAIPIALWMLKWFFWHLLLGGGNSSPLGRNDPWGW